MPTLTVTKNYDDGLVLTEAMLDAMKSSLETFFNTTKIDSDNIQTGGIATANIADAAITQAKLATDVLLPSGIIAQYGGTSAPSGWLLCDGSAVSRTTYAALFTAISTNYGVGDGATTFNVPDYRGRAAIGTGTGSGLTARTIGQTVGAETLPAHTHSVSGTTSTDGTHTHTESTTGQVLSLPGGDNATFLTAHHLGSPSPGAHTVPSTGSSHSHAFSATSGSTGTGSHGVMQPSLVSTYIIKT